MPLAAGTALGPYVVDSLLGTCGPASVRARLESRELRRGLAEAKKSAGR